MSYSAATYVHHLPSLRLLSHQSIASDSDNKTLNSSHNSTHWTLSPKPGPSATHNNNKTVIGYLVSERHSKLLLRKLSRCQFTFIPYIYPPAPYASYYCQCECGALNPLYQISINVSRTSGLQRGLGELNACMCSCLVLCQLPWPMVI